jgi:hypothetical protein
LVPNLFRYIFFADSKNFKGNRRPESPLSVNMAESIEFWRGLVGGFLAGVAIGVLVAAFPDRGESSQTSLSSPESGSRSGPLSGHRVSGAPSNVARFIAAES